MKIDIDRIATLANLTLDDAQKELLSTQLSSILSHIENLQEIDTAGVEETSQVTGLTNVVREDTFLPSLPQEEALSQATHTKDGQFIVKGVLQNG